MMNIGSKRHSLEEQEGKEEYPVYPPSRQMFEPETRYFCNLIADENLSVLRPRLFQFVTSIPIVHLYGLIILFTRSFLSAFAFRCVPCYFDIINIDMNFTD